MTYIEAKQKLHDYIEHASEEEVMEMISWVEPAKDNSIPYIYDEATLAMLNERSEEYLSGKEPAYPYEESMQRIQAQRKLNNK